MSSPAPSRRDQAKEERRQQILTAAESFIRERGDADFSMRALADASGVAFATPFNLFESKERLLATLLVRRVWPRQEELAEVSAGRDPIDHVFAFSAAALASYTDDAELLRPLLAVVLAPTVAAEGRSLEAGAELWARCLEPVRTAGVLRVADADDRLARTLHLTFRGVLLSWVRGDATAKDAAADLQYAVGVLLAGAVEIEAREAILARLGG